MLKGLKILFGWLIAGFLIDLAIANIYHAPNTSMSIKTTWLTVGLYLSFIHCLIIKVKKPNTAFRILIPSGFFVIIISEHFYSFYTVEKNCLISESDSLKSAIEYVKEINYDPRYLSKKPYNLDWCKLGFEYNSLDHYRLVIVSDDGTARLND
ncbi:MAG: hypothetical protein CL679_01550 [Bermanella sp.]|nr:hypothetical protein [Bermanella sp.]|tara:strand:+ start:28 stop:486 length:459 start_codon:yes stop_codon:yes gene_type:complete